MVTWGTAALLALSGATAVSASPARADTAPPAGLPATVSADALPTVQVDGVVWAQAVVGNTVYAGGKFTTARPAGSAPGTNTVTRNNLLAYDIRTGALVTSFAPDLNGQVLAVAASPDGSKVYVAGEFTKANGANRYRIAAYSTATGQLLSSFAPAFDFRARAIVATDTTVYVGGAFSSASGNTRTRLAAFRADNGALLSWAPTADAQVMAMVMAPGGGKVVIGGQFQKVNGADAYGLAALDPTSGALLPFAAGNDVRNAGSSAAINSLSTDGTNIYGTGYVFGPGGNLEGGFAARPSDGALVWIQDCHGDHYSGYSVGGVYYTVGHAHYCGNVGSFPQTNPWTFRRAIAFTNTATGTVARNTEGNYYNWEGKPAPTALTWWPELDAGTATGQSQAAWHVTGNGDYVVLGGEFPRVNGVAQQGLVRFAVRSIAPNKSGAVDSGARLVPRLSSVSAGSVRVAWKATWDRDNEALTYSVVRDGNTASPLVSRTVSSSFWQRPSMVFTDTVAPGTTHTYRLSATDPLGNVVRGDTVSITASSTTSTFGQKVLADGAGLYWRLGEASGATVVDYAGANDGTAGTGVSRGAAGALLGDPDKASTFDGTTSGFVATGSAEQAPNTFSTEAWFRTTATTGGKIVGFGNAATGTSNNYDRHVYMDSAGRITFGVYPGSVQTVRSTQAYNDGKWHQAVATLGSGGMTLYVDGVKVAGNAAVTSGQAFSGYWRAGGDNLAGWPGSPSSNYFKGDLDEVSVYPTALSAQQVAAHHSAATVAATNAAPTAAFTATTDALAASFDASASSDADGTIASYAWDFGDGSSGTGKTATRTYAAAGTYPVALTVTDDKGATNTTTKSVTVAAAPPPNTAPTAAFTATTSALTASFDAAGSTDADGTVASYAWTFGDGSSGTGKTASRTYAAAGTYPVKLTVTDDKGATDSVTKNVTVSAAPQPQTFAADAFGRSVTGGWGSADTGGAWTVGGGASNFAVASGTGTARLAAGSTLSATLGGVSTSSALTTVSVSLDKVPTGASAYVSVVGRRVSAGNEYRLKLRVMPDGSVTASLVKVVGNTETALRSATVAGLTYTAGTVLTSAVQVSGTSPTTVSAKVWKKGTAEPTAWLLTTTDSTAELQAAGAVGVISYLSGSTTNAPVTASYDDLSSTAPGA